MQLLCATEHLTAHCILCVAAVYVTASVTLIELVNKPERSEKLKSPFCALAASATVTRMPISVLLFSCVPLLLVSKWSVPT